MRRLLIVNADDLGLHEDINRGIYLAHTQGIVTSASLVACGEAFDHAITMVRGCRDLDLGVHLTLVDERPLSPPETVPTLVGPEGRFASTYHQVERVMETGRAPSHLDSHQHVHLLPSVWRVTRELARQYGIRWIRVPHFQSLVRSPRSLLDPVFRLGLNILSASATGLSSERDWRIQTIGLHLSGRLGEHDLLRLTTRLHPGISEIVTHPGVKTPALAARYRWDYQWSMELAALTSLRINSIIRSDGVSLTRFSDC